MFRRALPTLTLLMLLGACSDSASRRVKGIADHADRICACKDKACATKQSAALFAFLPTAKSRYTGKAQREAIAASMARIRQCIERNGVDKDWFQTRLDKAGGKRPTPPR